MLTTDEVLVGEVSVNDQPPNMSLMSHDNQKSTDCAQLEALRHIYEKICAIRKNHAQIVAENAAKRADIQQQLEVQKKKLEELEAEHLETGRSMKDFPVDTEEQTSIIEKYHSEQQELEHQRHVLEDLEFQMFEVDVHYEEQKELIQQQLVTEQQMISDVDSVYSASTDLSSTLSTTMPLSSQTDCSSKEFQGDSRLAIEDGDCEEQFSFDSECEETDTTVSSSALATLPESNITDEQEPLEQMSPSSNDLSVSQSDVADACLQRELSSSSSSSLCHLPVPDVTHFVTDCRRHTPLSARQNCDHCHSSVCYDHCVTEINDMLTTLSCDAVKKTQLLQQQVDEVERRVSISKRLQFQQQDVDDVIMLRNNGTKSQCQSRPLTRYLPVRGEPLDLLSFVEQAGHCVDRLAADITVTADTAAGFLVKMGGRIRTWRRRWFVFSRKDRQLAYYADQTQSPTRRTHRPKGCIDFSEIEDVFVFDRLSTIKSPAPDLTFCVKTTSRTYYIVAPTSEVRQLWIEIIFTGAEGYREFF